jgi:EAL domain-containing protein (putative c-di-GMP-specific phosphodiesterase class I)
MSDNPSVGSIVEVWHALEHEQLFVEYQAVFDVETGAVRGGEALVRWNHPEHGVVLPEAFLGFALRDGLGRALTEFVLHTAAGQCAAWRIQGFDIPVSVNVSAAALTAHDLPALVEGALDRHGIPADRLTLEITEHACEVQNARLRSTVTALARMGVRLSLDDFGTGDSSLSRLQQLHFDEVKIDRSFVAHVTDEPTDRNIVEFATGLAHSLGMKVVAEGVESEESLATVTEMGVDLVQGFLLHRPCAPEEFPSAHLLEHRAG